MGSAAILEKKKKSVDTLKEKINSASVLILSDYRSLTVREITELRKKLRVEESEFKIIKNTLLNRALEGAGYSGLKGHLQGPTALLLGYKEPIAPLKILVQYMKEAEKGAVKAGIFDRNLVDSKEIQAISKLPSREILISKVVGGLKSPFYGLANVMQGPIRKLVYALNAVKDKKGQGQGQGQGQGEKGV